MTMTAPVELFDASGAAHFIGKSEGWGQLNFQNGSIPTEALINGRKPAVTKATLTRMAKRLRVHGKKRKHQLN
jgi:hypothetical protein